MLQKPVIIPGSPLPQPLHLCHFKTPAGHVLPSASEIQNQWIKPISPWAGRGGRTTQRNNIMQTLPPAPLSLSTKSIGGKSLATLSQKSPSLNLHGRQSLARGYGHGPSFTPCQGPTCCCICQSRQLPAETKRLSPYALPSFCQVPHATFPSPSPNHPGSGEAGFWNQPAFLTPALVKQFLGQLSPPPCPEL